MVSASEAEADRRPSGQRRAIDGIVLLDKPVGLSSNQALQKVKRLFHALKAGHSGSLDPLASGMLPICLGQATKVSAFLLDADKVYRFCVAFGQRTETGDAEGAVVETGADRVGEAELAQALSQFRGELRQVPPMYSALKHEGKRLYELARSGQEIERAPRLIRIHELVVEAFDPHGPILRVRCSKGTYIRSLVEDIAEAAGTVGHVAALRRLAVAPFAESAMTTLEAMEAAARQGDEALRALMLAPDSALEGLPRVDLTVSEERGIRHGRGAFRDPAGGEQAGLVRLYGEQSGFLGVGERLTDQSIVPRRLMAEPTAGSGL
jgi:tRNA pseudouridine55 synthase